MIGFLKGKVISINNNSIILDINGVGWEANTGFISFELGNTVELFVHTMSKENELSLWGFKSREELEVFRMLMSVSGVGGKTAMSIVTLKGLGTISEAILNNKPEMLKVPGIGQKTSVKIILDLKDKIAKLNIKTDSKENNFKVSTQISDAIDALISLGYKQYDVEKSLDNIAKIKDVNSMSSQDIIREVLKTI
jgi:Holliday junction DNA helicase RuvA